jgi:CRISPR-associated protein Cmr1
LNNKICFDCEIVTPLLLYGADGKTPELRPPSLKGMMRFWWRAINGNLDTKSLKTKEGKIFGGIGKGEGQSTFSIFTRSNKIKTRSYKPLPRRERFEKTGFSPGEQFEVTLLMKKNKRIPPNWIGSLFEISCFLGGFGNRSRRGFGSLAILNCKPELHLICNKLNDICDDNLFTFNKASSVITSNFPSTTDYPSIKGIKVGQNSHPTHEVLLKRIANAAHKYNPRGSKALGKALGGRLASPVYVSVLKIGENYRPIVTVLNIVSDKDDSQKKFIKAICS